MKLCFIILAHESPDHLIPLLETLSAEGDMVVLHYDKSCPGYKEINTLKEKIPSLILCENMSVEWGESSIVRATVMAMKSIIESPYKPEYVTLLSGSCFPIKSRTSLVDFLVRNKGMEFIECHDIMKNGPWVKNGLEEERWTIYHFINWRKHPNAFTFFHKLQQKLHIHRNFPFGKVMYMGSQWWTLSYATIKKIVDLADDKLIKFIDKTWIPDEFFIQTLVGNLIPSNKISSPLMHYRFNKQGIPKIFTKGDYPELRDSDRFFARKFLGRDFEIRKCLAELYHGISGTIGKDNIIQHHFPYPYFARGRKRFHLDFRDYLLPVVILLTDDMNENSINDLWKDVKEKYPSFRIFGRVFAHSRIQLCQDDPIPLYNESSTELRDYGIDEFLSTMGLSSPSGFAFHLKTVSLPHNLGICAEMPNLTIIEKWDYKKYSMKRIKESYKNENFLSRFGCRFVRLTNTSNGILPIVEEAISSNIYLNSQYYHDK